MEKKMEEDIPNTNSKAGIKIPKTVVFKSTIKKNYKNSDSEADDDGKNKNGKWLKFRQNLLPGKMESVMSNVFGKDKLAKTKLFRSSSLKELFSNDQKKSSESQDTKASPEAGNTTSEDDDTKALSEAGYTKLSKAVAVNGIRMRRLRSVKVKQKEVKTETDNERDGDKQLCKKRILMGEKCKPLNVSGVLHYDQNGILLPEDVP